MFVTQSAHTLPCMLTTRPPDTTSASISHLLRRPQRDVCKSKWWFNVGADVLNLLYIKKWLWNGFFNPSNLPLLEKFCCSHKIVKIPCEISCFPLSFLQAQAEAIFCSEAWTQYLPCCSVRHLLCYSLYIVQICVLILVLCILIHFLDFEIVLK